jgi:hypothetical protein
VASRLPHVLNRCEHCEGAYRRGVHQALAGLRQYLQENGGSPMTALRQFEEIAEEFRYDNIRHRALVHEIAERLDGIK